MCEIEEELPLKDNEFTTSELLRYLNAAYRSKINQSKFTHINVATWVRDGSRFPEAYGGNTFTVRRLSGIRIYTIEELSRQDLHYLRDMQDEWDKKLVGVENKKRPMRTKLYYKLAKLPIPHVTLPDNWKEVGIRGNQLTSAK